MKVLDWDGLTKRGYLRVANVFLDHAASLDLSEGEMLLVLQILRHQWDARLPFPRVKALAKRMGVHEKTVRLRLRALRGKGLLRTVQRPGTTSLYDFRPLFDRLRTQADIDLPQVEVGIDTGVGESRTAETTIEVSTGKIVSVSEVDPTLDPSRPSPLNPSRHEEDQEPKKTNSLASPEREVEPDPVSPQPLGGRGPLGKLIDKELARARRVERGRRAVTYARRGGKTRRLKFDAKLTADYNCNDLELVFRDAYMLREWHAPPMFNGADRKLGKSLIEHYGAKAVVAVIQDVVAKWDEYVREFSLTGHPSLRLIYGFRDSFFPRVLNGATEPAAPKWGVHFGESKSRKGKDKGRGWGDDILTNQDEPK